MKITLNTEMFKDLVTRAMKCCSDNRLLPITSLLSIEVENTVLTLITTDASNYLYLRKADVNCDDFSVVVVAEKFSKLISKTTSETVTLELIQTETGAELRVTGNGTYSLELPLDEEGQLITYPNPVKDTTSGVEISLNTFRVANEVAKSSLAIPGPNTDGSCYLGYYMHDKVVTTNLEKLCCIDIPVFDSPMLISPEMMELLTVMTSDSANVIIGHERLTFVTDDCIVYGPVLDGVDTYRITELSELLNEGFSSMCKISKNDIVALLDRLTLFVDVYDENVIRLTFTRDGIVITSKKSSGSELIQYTHSENFKEFSCFVNIRFLLSQLKSYSSDIVELWYGEDNAIKIVENKITQMLALAEE